MLAHEAFAIKTIHIGLKDEPARAVRSALVERNTRPRYLHRRHEPRDGDMLAAMVADVHRILTRGGLFMYPRDSREPSKPGKLRLMYEANPMSFLVEQAGGASTDGHQRILDIQPEGLHQRVAVFLGSKEEVARITAYHKA